MATTNWWRKCLWWFTPLGRVRLALAAADRSAVNSAVRLRSGLVTLRDPARRADSEVRDLECHVLAKLVEGALAEDNFEGAFSVLAELDGCDATAELRLPLRLRLVRALISSGRESSAMEAARGYVRDPDSAPDSVGELLRWALRTEGKADI